MEFLTEASFNSNTFLAAMLFCIVQPLHLPDTSGLIKVKKCVTLSAFLLHAKTGKNFGVKGTGQFSSVKMERDERVPFTPSYVKKTLNPPKFSTN